MDKKLLTTIVLSSVIWFGLHAAALAFPLWDANTAYDQGTEVEFNGNSWICTPFNGCPAGDQPDISSNWVQTSFLSTATATPTPTGTPPTATPTATATTAPPTATPTTAPTVIASHTVDFGTGPGDWIGRPWDTQINPTYHTTTGDYANSCAGFGPGYWQSTEPTLTNQTFNEWYNYAFIESTHKLSFSSIVMHRIGSPGTNVNWFYIYTSDDGENWTTAGSVSTSNTAGCNAQAITANVANKYVRVLYQHRANTSAVGAGIYRLDFTNYIDHGGPVTPDPDPTCTTVANADFSTAADWTADPSLGAVAVEDGDDYYWVLGNESSIYQDVPVTPGVNYAAQIVVHSTTPDETPTDLQVTLGSSSDNLHITGAGVYTAYLTAPLNGLNEYRIYNYATDVGVNLDFTCLYTATGSNGPCLAENADFTEPVDDLWGEYAMARNTADPVPFEDGVAKLGYGDTIWQPVQVQPGTFYNISIEVERVDYITTNPTQIPQLAVWLNDGEQHLIEIDGPGIYQAQIEALSTPQNALLIENYSMPEDQFVIWVSSVCATGDGGANCNLTGSDFNSADGWTLTGSAAITGSVLIMGSGDSAAQNITLDADTTYTVEVDVATVAAGPVGLDVAMGIESVTLLDVAPGPYSSDFTTPATLAGPLEFRLTQAGVAGSMVTINYICITGDGDDGTRTCIAPTNGDFTSADGWQLFNGALHDALNLRATLPYGDPDRALIATTDSYSMPTLAEGEYLILGFTALAEGAAYIGSQAGALPLDYEVYEAAYDYEADISSQAGATIDFSFANIGSSGFPATGQIYLDDVCVFVSNEPPNATTPSDPDAGYKPVRFGWSVGCGDIPAILAGLGIDVFALQDTYAAGVSVWEFSGWVPWLAAALWVNVGSPVLCVILTMFNWLVGMLEYIINEGLNWANWGQRSARAFVIWAGNNLNNLDNFTEATAARWLAWGTMSAINVWGFFSELNIQTMIDWLQAAEDWLMDSLWAILQAVFVGTPVEGATDTIDDTTTVFRLLISWLTLHLVDFVFIPLDFYQAFRAGINASSYNSLFTCSGANFWCTLLAGMQLINRVSAHTIGYPAVIFGIIVGTIWIFWRHIWELLTIRVG